MKMVKKLKYMSACLWVFALTYALVFGAEISLTKSNPDWGSMQITGDALVAGKPGELKLEFRAGKNGLQKGWRVWVELSAGWYNKLGCPREDKSLKWQHEDNTRSGYYEARKIPDGLKIIYETGSHADIYGTSNRFVRVFSFQVEGRSLSSGEGFNMIFGHNSIKGRFHVPGKAGSGPIRWKLASPKEKPPYSNPVQAQLFADSPRRGEAKTIWLEILPAEPKYVEVTVPSNAKVNEYVSVKVRLLDENYNLVKKWPGPVRLEASGPVQGLTEKVTPGDTGVATAQFKASSASVVRINATVDGVGKGISNPMEVRHSEPVYRIYWGDVHAHSQISHDGMGVKPFDYARDASALDFFTLTEHVRATNDHEWDEILGQVAEHNDPGQFDTILALEDSAHYPSGHFNLYFKQSSVPKRKPTQIRDVPRAYGKYKPLLIQHHTGIQWYVKIGRFQWALPYYNRIMGDHVGWDAFPKVKRTAVEIYSLHGSSEKFDPSDKLAYEHCDLRLAIGNDFGACKTGTSADGPHYAQDGWAAGHVMGTVSGSDDHVAQPGKRGGGLTAVMANAHTREAIHDAMGARRTYATTGDRIIMDFKINGKDMGSVIEPSREIRVHAKAIGTAEIKRLEILRYDWKTGKWEAAIEVEPGNISVEINRTLETTTPAIYYMRLEQKGLVRGRPVRAWSSPIWVGTPRKN